MTRIIVESEDEPITPEPVEVPAEIAPDTIGPPVDVLEDLAENTEVTQEQLEETQEQTATAFEEVADDIGDLYDVVAGCVSAIDSIIDYLQDLYDAEIAEGHTDIEPPTEPTQQATKVKKKLSDTEPNSRHKVRPFILGRSGGMFR